jgi:hypothetical protein
MTMMMLWFRAALGINPSALRPGCELLAGLRDRQGWVTPTQRTGQTCSPRPRKPGLELRRRRRKSLWREPRWNADSRAPSEEGAAVPVRHGIITIASVGVSPPNFFSSLRAKRSNPVQRQGIGLLRRFAPRNDGQAKRASAKSQRRHHPCFLFRSPLRASRDDVCITRAQRCAARMSMLACLPSS